MSQVYKSTQVKEKLRAVTERMREEIPGEKTDHYIQTSFGDTYVLEMGDPSQETLVLSHGAMTNHAVILSVMRHLVGRYHLIIPDLPGHAGWSTERHLDPMGDDYGRWLLEVLDAFKIDSCHFTGLSYGCFVANRLIALAPDRVNWAFFMVPAGFILLSAWTVIKHFLLWVILLGIEPRRSPRTQAPSLLFAPDQVAHFTAQSPTCGRRITSNISNLANHHSSTENEHYSIHLTVHLRA